MAYFLFASPLLAQSGPPAPQRAPINAPIQGYQSALSDGKYDEAAAKRDQARALYSSGFRRTTRNSPIGRSGFRGSAMERAGDRKGSLPLRRKVVRIADLVYSGNDSGRASTRMDAAHALAHGPLGGVRSVGSGGGSHLAKRKSAVAAGRPGTRGRSDKPSRAQAVAAITGPPRSSFRPWDTRAPLAARNALPTIRRKPIAWTIRPRPSGFADRRRFAALLPVGSASRRTPWRRPNG